MANEFFTRFSNYSNVELLKIIKQSGEYQPDALKIANEILSTRTITDYEKREVEEYYNHIELKNKKKREQVESFNKQINDLFEPLLHPTINIAPNRWLNLFLLAVIIQYLWSLYEIIKNAIAFYQCTTCLFSIFMVLNYINLIYIPIVFYLLRKRKKWGWILLFTDNLYSVLLLLSQFYSYLKYPEYNNIGIFILNLFIKSAFIIFLLRPDVASYFHIDYTKKKKYALIITGVLLVLLIGISIIITIM